MKISIYLISDDKQKLIRKDQWGREEISKVMAKRNSCINHFYVHLKHYTRGVLLSLLFETGFHYITQADLKLKSSCLILLSVGITSVPTTLTRGGFKACFTVTF